jgi:hypothetical protein
MRRLALCLFAAVLTALAGCALAKPAVPTPTNTVTIPAEYTAEPTITPRLLDVMLYQPNAALSGLTAIVARAEDSPRGLLAALVDVGALPDVDYGTNLTFGVAEETVPIEDGEVSGAILRLDLPDAFAQVFRQAGEAKETLLLQSLVNTFLARYQADAMILTIEGTVLETTYGKYENPIVFDEFASTMTD